MNNISRHKLFNLVGIFFFAMVFFLSSCAEEQEFKAAPPDNPAITELSEMSKQLQQLKADSRFGTKAGTYPISSQQIIDEAIAELSRLILDIYSGTKNPSDSEIETAINKAKTEKQRFKGTLLTEDMPWDGKPAELYVDGLNDGYIDFGGKEVYTNFPKRTFTVELWIKMTKVRDGIGFLVGSFRENGGDRNGWMINYLNYDFMRVSYATGNDGLGLREEGTGYMGSSDWREDGQIKENWDSPWLHIAWVYNENGFCKFYLNGVLKENRVTWEIVDHIKEDYSPYLPMTAFLQRDAEGSNSRPIAGYMKHFRIWKSAKNAQEVNELMNGKEISGDETDLVCAWPFDETVENDKEIVDLTGRHTASINGVYRWEEQEDTE